MCARYETEGEAEGEAGLEFRPVAFDDSDVSSNGFIWELVNWC